jgi:hypothetical protein
VTTQSPVIAGAGKELVGIGVGLDATSIGQTDLRIGEIAIVEAAALGPPGLIVVPPASVLTWSAPGALKANVWAKPVGMSCVSFLGPAFTDSYETAHPMFPLGAGMTVESYRVQPVSTAGVAAPLDLPMCSPSSGVPSTTPTSPTTTTTGALASSPAPTGAGSPAPHAEPAVAVVPRFTG